MVNIIDATQVTGKSNGIALTTAAQALVNNAALSGKLVRVVSLYIANVGGVAAASLTVNIYSQASLGGTPFAIASAVEIPAKSTLVLVEKSPIYLEADRSLGALASAAGDLVAYISWEELS